jgi:predicted enzyme related to lactoylglutathione lyase
MLSTNYVPGAPIWVDLGTSDIDAAAAFYRELFGWEFVSFGPDAGGYGVLTLDGKTAAALGPLMAEGTEPSWTVYFDTQNADATADSVTSAGGVLLAEPFDVFTQGRMGQFADPAGAAFAVWQPGDTKGLDVVNAPGSLSWTELQASDPGAAVSFYQAVFGWSADQTPMGGFTYTLLKPRGGDDNSTFGGIMPLTAELTAVGITPGWRPYFEVADCDAAVDTADKHGGTVVAPPMDIPQAGRMAALLDPAGAAFSVITSAAM